MSTGSARQRRQRHALVYEGAPHDSQGVRIISGRWPGVGGHGRALCYCGEMSDPLPSAYARRNWHRLHKAKMAGLVPDLARDLALLCQEAEDKVVTGSDHYYEAVVPVETLRALLEEVARGGERRG